MVGLAHALLLPPGLIFLLLALGFLCLFMLPRFGRWCLFLGILSLYLLSIAPVAEFFIGTLEDTPSLTDTVEVDGEQAIVVLGASRYYGAPEYGGGDAVGEYALMRLRYAQRLNEATDLPVLVSGGRPRGETRSEADLMNETLQQSFDSRARWLEESSPNTFVSAVCSQKLLEGEAIDTIFLVTHAVHMPRALYAFETVGMNVTPAPTGYLKDAFAHLETAKRWWPSLKALQISQSAVHEWLGLIYYNLFYARASTIMAVQDEC